MRLHIVHRTSYHYDTPMPYALQRLRMIPKDSAGQRVVRWKTEVEGGSKQVEYIDHHNNHVELFSFNPDQHEVVIHCEGEVETSDHAGMVGQHGGSAPLWYFRRDTPFTRPGAGIRKLLRQFDDPGAANGDAPRLHALSELVRGAVAYEVGQTGATTTAEEALNAGHGVCQDHAHLFITLARLLGYPARYVSGYLLMNDRTEQDAGHGWAEVHAQGLGWVGFDISNGYSPDERYVRVATGLDYREAAPIGGITFGRGNEAMTVTLTVQQVQAQQ